MFDRIFMTGVSPVTLDDLTSGFNIGWNISTDYRFNRMLGFSEEDVREMLLYYKTAGELPEDTGVEVMIEDMKPCTIIIASLKKALNGTRKCSIATWFFIISVNISIWAGHPNR